MPLIWIRDFGSQKKGSWNYCVRMFWRKCWSPAMMRERRLFWNLQRNFLRGEVTGSWKKWSCSYTNMRAAIHSRKSGWMRVWTIIRWKTNIFLTLDLYRSWSKVSVRTCRGQGFCWMRRCISVRSLTDRICMQRRWKRILWWSRLWKRQRRLKHFTGRSIRLHGSGFLPKRMRRLIQRRKKQWRCCGKKPRRW